MRQGPTKPKTHILSPMSFICLCGRGSHYLIDVRNYKMVLPGQDEPTCKACINKLSRLKQSAPTHDFSKLPLLRPKTKREML